MEQEQASDVCFFCVIYILMLSHVGDYTLKRKDLTLF